MSGERDWLQVVLLPAAIASIPGGIGLWQWWVNRKDRNADATRTASMTAAERREAALVAEREALTKEQRERFEWIEAERDRAWSLVTRLQADLERERLDKQRGWDTARWWNRRAHELRHDGLNAQTAARNLATRIGEGGQAWPDMTLPSLEDPFPRQPDAA